MDKLAHVTMFYYEPFTTFYQQNKPEIIQPKRQQQQQQFQQQQKLLHQPLPKSFSYGSFSRDIATPYSGEEINHISPNLHSFALELLSKHPASPEGINVDTSWIEEGCEDTYLSSPEEF